MAQSNEDPKHASFDVVILGGAMLRSSVAWFHGSNPVFTRSALVVDRAPEIQTQYVGHRHQAGDAAIRRLT